MSLFGTILTKIFGQSEAKAAEPTSSSGTMPDAPAGAAPASDAASAGTAPAQAPVDVEAVLSGLAQQKGGTLNWRTSIVDLLKLLDLDSSLQARKELASELHYSGDTDDTATMNVWLIKQVMQKLAENGGKVPEDLKH